MLKKIILYVFFIWIITSCDSQYKQNLNVDNQYQKFDKNISIELNNQWVKDESFRINQYCSRQGIKTKVSKSGLRYFIIEDVKGLSYPEPGDYVVLSYDVRLMDPFKTRCYHSDSNGLAKFQIEKSMVESGLHEVVTYLNKGDSALVILPHFLAHGVTGDSKKIPPLSSVLYYIKLIDVIK